MPRTTPRPQRVGEALRRLVQATIRQERLADGVGGRRRADGVPRPVADLMTPLVEPEGLVDVSGALGVDSKLIEDGALRRGVAELGEDR